MLWEDISKFVDNSSYSSHGRRGHGSKEDYLKAFRKR